MLTSFLFTVLQARQATRFPSPPPPDSSSAEFINEFISVQNFYCIYALVLATSTFFGPHLAYFYCQHYVSGNRHNKQYPFHSYRYYPWQQGIPFASFSTGIESGPKIFKKYGERRKALSSFSLLTDVLYYY